MAAYQKIKKGEIKTKRGGRSFAIDKKDLGGILKGKLTEKEKKEIGKIVKRVVKEYGETLKLLGKI